MVKISNEDLLGHIIEIKSDTAGINEHLKTLNGKVSKNVTDIEEHREKIENINLTLAYYVGGATAILFLVELALRYLLK